MKIDNERLTIALTAVAAITIGLGWRIYPSSPKMVDYGEANPRNESYKPGGHDCETKALAAIPDEGKRAKKSDECAQKVEAYRQQANDLIQQTRAADAAQAQADIASQQLWAGWFQTLGGYLTLAAAVGAAYYAKKAAEETKRAAEIAKKNLAAFQAAERGHLRVWVNGASRSSEYEAIYFGIGINNYGKSPVKIIRTIFGILKSSQYAENFQYEQNYNRIIECDGEIDNLNLMIPNFPIDEVKYFGGYVEYTCRFMELHRTYFVSKIEEIDRSSGLVSSSYTHRATSVMPDRNWPSDS